MLQGGIMKKVIFTVIILLVLLAADAGMAQNLEATKQYLETQLEIIRLQSTLDAIQNQTAPTPAPYVQPQPSVSELTNYNFPSFAMPPIPAGPDPVWDKPKSSRRTDMYVGDTGTYSTIAEALKNVPANAGEVVIYLVSDTEEPPNGFGIPIDKRITSLRITSNNNSRRTVYPSGRSVWFFCNGIPLYIEQQVVFSTATMIMGGLVTYSGHNVTANSSTIIVDGKAYWVYAGGQSDRDGHTSTVNNALVIINGEVDRVYGGGRAILGDTYVQNASVIVRGTAKEVYCSGYTENASARSIVGRADMRVYGRFNKYGIGLGQGQLSVLNPYGCIN